MESEDMLAMNSWDRKRLYVIQQSIDEKMTQKEAAEVLRVSERQIRRLVRRVKQVGDSGILHASRGKTSRNRIPAEIKERVLEYCKSRYAGFGPKLAGEKLLEEKEIAVSDETLRIWMIEGGLEYRKRRGRRHREWRPRKECFGEMLQMDGSHHDWLEGRGAKLVLMGYIDDATNCVYARFYDYEGTIPAFDGLKGYIEKYGIPCRIYLDRHSTYKSTKKISVEEELQGIRVSKSQFERAMLELGVRVIHANSAPAKGRIERLFRTFQDRLVKEMRLQQITTKEEANLFLEKYLAIHNQRFGVAAKKATNLHRPVPKGIRLETILCKKTNRFLRNDFTIIDRGKLYQIHRHINAKTVTIEEWLNGSFHISHNGSYLSFTEIPRVKKELLEESEKPVSMKGRTRKPPIPGINHPWRRFSLNKRKTANRTF